MLLDAGMRELLTELAHLELKAMDPNWLRTLEKENVGITESDASQQRRGSTRRRKRESSIGGP